MLPGHDEYVPQALQHYVEGNVGHAAPPQVLISNLEDMPNLSPRRVIWKNNQFVREEGLFPTQKPGALIACPSYYSATKLVLRSLTSSEELRIYQLPLAMDMDLLSVPNYDTKHDWRF